MRRGGRVDYIRRGEGGREVRRTGSRGMEALRRRRG